MNWEEFQNEIKELAGTIVYSPDIVVAVVRGGLIPARMLAAELKVKDMYCLTVKKRGEERRVMNEILEDLGGKKILLVEDMLETGKSLIVAKLYLENKGAEVKTACLYTMAQSEMKSDYFLREVTEVQKFPWES